MARNFELVVVKDLTLEQLAAAGWTSDGVPIAGDAALTLSSPGPSAASVDGDVVIADPVMEIGVLAHGLAAQLGHEVFAITIGTEADLYVWRAADARGERQIEWVGGDLVHESGEPHPAEEGIGELGEDALWALLERTTGVTRPAVEAARFQPVVVPGGDEE